VLDPCLPQGAEAAATTEHKKTAILRGTGDPEECTKLVSEVVSKPTCEWDHCGMQAVYQPELNMVSISIAIHPLELVHHSLTLSLSLSLAYSFAQDIPYMAMDHFTRVAEFFRIPSLGAPLVLLETAALDFCAKTWEQQHAEFGELEQPMFPVENYCFEGLYCYQMLTRGFGFHPQAKNVLFEEHINGAAVTWALGVMVLERDKHLDLFLSLQSSYLEDRYEEVLDTPDSDAGVLAIAVVEISVGSAVVVLLGAAVVAFALYHIRFSPKQRGADTTDATKPSGDTEEEAGGGGGSAVPAATSSASAMPSEKEE